MTIKGKPFTVILVVLLYWLLSFAPSWLDHSFIKTLELLRTIGQSKDESLVVMHPARKIQSLIDMKNYLINQNDYSLSDIAIFAPERSSSSPLTTDPSILRAISYPVPVVRDNMKPGPFSLVVITQESVGQNFKSLQAKFCKSSEISVMNCSCLENISWLPANNQEVLCWLLP